MPQKVIGYAGELTRLACDGNCQKAWGVSHRPKVQLSDDPDDVVFMADPDLGEAPADPGTYEGGQGKPTSAAFFPTKWCIRECERCTWQEPGADPKQPIRAKDWFWRVYNQPWKHQGNEEGI